MMLLNRPITKNGIQPAAVFGRLAPANLKNGNNSAAAMATRPSASVIGGNSRNETLTKKNEPPHKTDNKINSSQVWRSIVVAGACISKSVGLRARD